MIFTSELASPTWFSFSFFFYLVSASFFFFKGCSGVFSAIGSVYITSSGRHTTNTLKQTKPRSCRQPCKHKRHLSNVSLYPLALTWSEPFARANTNISVSGRCVSPKHHVLRSLWSFALKCGVTQEVTLHQCASWYSDTQHSLPSDWCNDLLIVQ